MEELKNILGQKSFQEPAEVANLKKYILDTLGAKVSIATRDQNLVIIADNAALAGTLRMHMPQLQALCAANTKLIIRIGS